MDYPVCLKVDSTGVVISLYCQPGAKKTEVSGEFHERLKIRLAAPPVEGQANEVLLKWLSKVLSCPQKSIRLVSGELARQKRVRVDGLTPVQLIEALKL